MSREIFNTDKKSLRGRIKQIRNAQNLTQQAFAKSLGIAQGFLSELEKGKYEPTQTILMAICYLYQINIDWLLTGEGQMYRHSDTDTGTDTLKIDIKDIPLYNIKEWLDEFWAAAGDDEKAWLKIEFGRCFPEYKDWLLKKELDEAGEPPLSQANGAA